MIERAPRSGHFTIVPNGTLRDTKLSFRARGILAYILSMPDGWQTNSDRITAAGTEGREAVRSAMRELEAAGYIRRVKHRLDNGRYDTKVLVYDEPQPEPKNPSAVPPAETREPAGHTGDRKPDGRFTGRLKEDILLEDSSLKTWSSAQSPAAQLALVPPDGHLSATAPAPELGVPIVSSTWDLFWQKWPRKIQKQTALGQWRALRGRGVSDVAILEGLDRWLAHWEADSTPLDKIPYPNRWLKDKYWEDTPTPVVPRQARRPTRADANAEARARVVAAFATATATSSEALP